MGKYKLTYFNGRGLGETVRYIFAYAGVDYEDVRWEWPEWEKEGKKNFEWGQLPELTLPDGQKLTQSCAIFRYLGRQFGLVPADDLQSARCDECVDALWDLIRGDWRKYVTEEDKEKKAKLREELRATHFPNFLSKINAYVKRLANGSWGDQLSWGDFFYANLLELFQDYVYGADILGPYPELKRVRLGVEELPGVKEWRAKRLIEKGE